MAQTPHKRAVGDRLRITIEAVAPSQAAFARVMDVSPTKLGNWLRGDNYPEPLFLIRVCNEFGVTMDWFYRGSRAGVAASVAASLRQAEEASAGP